MTVTCLQTDLEKIHLLWSSSSSGNCRARRNRKRCELCLLVVLVSNPGRMEPVGKLSRKDNRNKWENIEMHFQKGLKDGAASGNAGPRKRENGDTFNPCFYSHLSSKHSWMQRKWLAKKFEKCLHDRCLPYIHISCENAGWTVPE